MYYFANFIEAGNLNEKRLILMLFAELLTDLHQLTDGTTDYNY